jgi:hypothetical protein
VKVAITFNLSTEERQAIAHEAGETKPARHLAIEAWIRKTVTATLADKVSEMHDDEPLDYAETMALTQGGTP